MIKAALALAGAACLLVAGKSSIAKILLIAGLPSLAAPLLEDPAVRGVAQYKGGNYQAAEASFKEAGRGSTYNRGLSLAATGDYPLSRAYFDAVLFANPADSEARDNRNAVNALIPPHLGEANAAGRIAAKVIATAGGPPLDEVKRLGRPLDMGRRVADAEWLATLPDDAGEFLKLRLSGEYQRRMSLGLMAGEEENPW